MIIFVIDFGRVDWALTSDVMSKQQVRVFLWAVPRSISTAFFRAMMNKTNCKVRQTDFPLATFSTFKYVHCDKKNFKIFLFILL